MVGIVAPLLRETCPNGIVSRDRGRDGNTAYESIAQRIDQLLRRPESTELTTGIANSFESRETAWLLI
jgi:hypothetical protein